MRGDTGAATAVEAVAGAALALGGGAQFAHLGAFGELLGAGGDQRGQLCVGGGWRSTW